MLHIAMQCQDKLPAHASSHMRPRWTCSSQSSCCACSACSTSRHAGSRVNALPQLLAVYLPPKSAAIRCDGLVIYLAIVIDLSTPLIITPQPGDALVLRGAGLGSSALEAVGRRLRRFRRGFRARHAPGARPDGAGRSFGRAPDPAHNRTCSL